MLVLQQSVRSAAVSARTLIYTYESAALRVRGRRMHRIIPSKRQALTPPTHAWHIQEERLPPAECGIEQDPQKGRPLQCERAGRR